VLRLPLITLTLAAGCPAGGETSGETGGETGAEVDPNAPVVEEATVTCFLHTTGEQFVQWNALATVSDPQGLSTIETFGTVVIRDARGELGSVDLVCTDGSCLTSWRDHEFDIECDAIAATTYDFAFTVVDIDGHASAELIVPGEKVDEP
jgi:hypothetical protein